MDATTVSEYDQALSRFAGQDAQIEQGLERFAAAFSDLTAPDLAERFQALYASEIYFNDTLHVFHERDALVDYMRRTGASLTESHVEIKQVIQDEADVYVRWVMEFKTRAAGRDVHSHSIGMTHLRFDENGQVVLHQDFWDSGHALYAHLPFVGFAIRQARNRME
ncbi:nuclear transport factor 2 family protein [Wenzhouxiangella sp. AB-CW3]|uniref:nuclear transport factor 2 family protein n=1 Tax=Wenzhouxiangella sp. AB-CW3 TaxID=2771012 RepID=UPI00168B2CF9|nr:nuclear transport factor 2 family protein [Wenzhouxiangella sp. AB-CW3]QOC23339.1 nuclear transport factor 2 family protein [Wenzhouxiangella sp. AB-CW3]